MDFRLTDEQRMLRRTIRDLVEKEFPTRRWDSPPRFESSAGKLFANEMALQVTDLALQLHGGYRFSREFPVERLLREGMVLGGGPPQLQRNMIADELIKRGFPPWS